jgi:glycosyltransferase involved in cell wall biosynthesis
MQNGQPRVTVLYHYFHPDDVVSARHYEEFCRGLVARHWRVEALPCNRGCRDESKLYAPSENWSGISIRRIWRPGLKQASKVGRIANSAWMIAAWCKDVLLRRRKNLPDVLVIGTDPVLSVAVAWVVKKLRPSVRTVHWCYDLYPEAPIAEGMFRENSLTVRMVKRVAGASYRSCDLVADLGSCMRGRLETYGHQSRKVTLPPWALAEPDAVALPDPQTRRDLFGGSSLGLLYSGNFGHAHSADEFLELARCVRDDGVHICFGVRGNSVNQLRAAVRPDDTNVSFAGFAPESVLEARLAAADIHLASLRPNWTGIVVPSKFFGSLATGRPVIFAGPSDSCIARWICEYEVGWVLNKQSLPAIANELRELARGSEKLKAIQRRCHEVYQSHFSQHRIMDRWDEELRSLLNGTGEVIGNGERGRTNQ